MPRIPLSFKVQSLNARVLESLGKISGLIVRELRGRTLPRGLERLGPGPKSGLSLFPLIFPPS